jgi:gamma-glutamylputrescine oxidase
MERQWGKPPWLAGAQRSAPALANEVEVAIIGGGLTGLSSAYHLARAGIGAVMLEAAACGEGASGRTGGIVLEGTARGVVAGTANTAEFMRDLVAREEIECDLRLPGCWEIEHRPGRDDTWLPWLDGDQPIGIARTVPGGAVDPGALMIGLARAAERAGAELHFETPVAQLAPGTPSRLRLSDRVLRAHWVVLAVNAWSAAFVPISVRSSLTYACATNPLSEVELAQLGLSAGIPFYTIDQPYLWGRHMRDRRMIFGAGLSFGTPDELENLTWTSPQAQAILTRLKHRVRNLHPALAEVQFSAEWAGPIAFLDRMTPLLCALPDTPTVLVAGGYAGHGVAMSVWAGAQLAAAIAERRPLPAWGALS